MTDCNELEFENFGFLLFSISVVSECTDNVQTKPIILSASDIEGTLAASEMKEGEPNKLGTGGPHQRMVVRG